MFLIYFTLITKNAITKIPWLSLLSEVCKLEILSQIVINNTYKRMTLVGNYYLTA